MNRRDFFQSASAATLGLGIIPAGLMGCGVRPPSRDFRLWTWVHGNNELTSDEWRDRFQRIWHANIRGVLISGNEPTPVEAARSAGLEVHRWSWILNRNGDSWAKENHPEWFTVNRNGESTLDQPPYVNYYRWVCPTRSPVRAYLKGVVEQIAEDPSIDGVHLDYIRHSDVILPVGLWSRYDLVQDREYPEFDYCYCDVCRQTFSAETGVDPMALRDPSSNVAWREFRWNSVTEVVRILADAVRDRGKRISAAVFPTPTIARTLVRQDWERWPLDAFFPMVYHNFYDETVPWVGAATREGVAALHGSAPLYTGLYLPSLAPDDLAEAVRTARAAGASGVSLFEMGGLTDAHLASLREATA